MVFINVIIYMTLPLGPFFDHVKNLVFGYMSENHGHFVCYFIIIRYSNAMFYG